MRLATFAVLAVCLSLVIIPYSTIGEVTVTKNIASKPLVCVNFYVWYGWNATSHQWEGTNQTSHWNDEPARSFRDRPVSFYSSMNNATLAWQTSQMEQAGVNCIIVSWWGEVDYTNNSTLNLFKYIHDSETNLKIAIMVEPYQGLNITTAENYVQDHFYSVFPNEIFKWQGKPLLAWFLPSHPSNDTRFTIRVLGNMGGEDWKYVSGRPNAHDGSNKANADELKDYMNGTQVAADGEVTVIPRFDNWYEYSIGGRSDYIRFNVNYSTNLLQQGMGFAYGAHAKLILITSWNEYTESSEIEAHYSPSSKFVPNPLVDMSNTEPSLISVQ